MYVIVPKQYPVIERYHGTHMDPTHTDNNIPIVRLASSPQLSFFALLLARLNLLSEGIPVLENGFRTYQ